jgi:hypothetical protein
MTRKQPSSSAAAFNRALLSRQPVDSSALAVRGALFHRFVRPGRYEVVVRRGSRAVHRELLVVADQQGATQLDVRLGDPADEQGCQCGKRDAAGGALQTGGVMAFHAARGSANYQVRIERWHDKGRELELDSAAGLPAGDLFAASLVTPGRYRVLLGQKAVTDVVVRPPQPGKPHRTDQPVLLKTGGKAQKKGVEIDAGNSIVLWLEEPGTVRFEPLELLGEKVKAA